MNSFGFFKIKSCFWLTRVELGTSGTHLAPVIPAKALELAGGCIKVTIVVPVLYYIQWRTVYLEAVLACSSVSFI